MDELGSSGGFFRDGVTMSRRSSRNSNPTTQCQQLNAQFPNSEGRPKYKLVPEGAGKEVDVSAR